jgi:hypothetical protein
MDPSLKSLIDKNIYWLLTLFSAKTLSLKYGTITKDRTNKNSAYRISKEMIKSCEENIKNE